MENKPIKVGITGGIGAGKSIVCEVFKVLNVPVYDADERAKSLMVNDEMVVSKIKKHFGKESYKRSGVLNRSFLSKSVFGDPDKMNVLNGIVHPAVEHNFVNWTAQNENQRYILKEAALLVETGSYKRLDFLITVTAPEKVRIKRVLNRDAHRTVDDVQAIISSQLAEDKKASLADFVIINDDKTLLIPQILKINEFFNKLGQTG